MVLFIGSFLLYTTLCTSYSSLITRSTYKVINRKDFSFLSATLKLTKNFPVEGRFATKKRYLQKYRLLCLQGSQNFSHRPTQLSSQTTGGPSEVRSTYTFTSRFVRFETVILAFSFLWQVSVPKTARLSWKSTPKTPTLAFIFDRNTITTLKEAKMNKW